MEQEIGEFITAEKDRFGNLILTYNAGNGNEEEIIMGKQTLNALRMFIRENFD